MSECVKVVVRCRPLNNREKSLGCVNVIQMDKKQNSVTIKKQNPTNSSEDQPKNFAFDAVFFTDSKQDELYEETAFPLVEQVFEGYNGTIFAYGQTGCGKSFSMMGVPEDPVLKGIIPRTFDHIINVIDSDNSGKTFLVMVSYIEIYMEEIRDLLAEDVSQKLDLKEDPQKGVYVKGLNKVIVKSVKEMSDLMNKGNDNRQVGATLMNATSSRSHSIFCINVEVQEKIAEEESFKAGKLNLVDLAGSEKQSKTQAEGARLKEATKINLSLSALGNVISALSTAKGGHIPYRDSKLTRLLQDSLGGNTKTIMMAALSPADDNYDETVSTLRYAARTKNIKNKPVVNMDPKDALLKEYQEEINRLKQMLANGGSLPAEEMPQQSGRLRQMSISQDQQIKMNNMNNMPDEEMNQQLKDKEAELLNEKQQREKLEEMLKNMEENKMHGGGDQSTQNDEQAKKYQKMKARLKKERQNHEKMREEQEKRELEMLNVNKKYASLQEEVEELREIANQAKKKYEYQSQELRDQEKEHQIEKEELLETIRLQDRDHQLNTAIIDMLLSIKEYEIIKNSSTWIEDKGSYKIPPFIFKDKKLKFPKLPPNLANDLIQEEKDNRVLDFGDQQQNDFPSYNPNPENIYKKKNKQRYVNSSNNSIDEQNNNNMSAFYNGDSNQMRGRVSMNQSGASTNSTSFRVQKLSGTRQKFYSANPYGKGNELQSPQKIQKPSVDKKHLPTKLTPLDSIQQQKVENLKNSILENDSQSFCNSPQKPVKNQKNGIHLNPIIHNPQLSNSQLSESMQGFMNNQVEYKKHNGLAPLNYPKKL